MNYQDRAPQDPRRTEAPLEGMDSFVSESTIVLKPFKAKGPDPLWEFPEEAFLPVAAPTTGGSFGRFSVVLSVGAAIAVAAIGGVWWTGSLREHAQVVANPPAVPAELPQAATAPVTTLEPVIPSVEVRPLREEPLANVAFQTVAVAREGSDPLTKTVMGSDPSREKPVALSAAATQQPNSRVPTTTMARGTSGAGVQPLRGFTPQPAAEPVAAPPVVSPNPSNAISNVMTRSAPVEPTPPALAAAPVVPPTVARTPEPATRPVPEAVATVAGRTEQTGIQQVLGQYRSAYGRLDADAARTVWPSVDARALARAFDSLSSQELAFDSCNVDIAGETATAQCRGSATYTPKIGSRGPKLEARQWVFHLRKAADGWKIQSAQTRR